MATETFTQNEPSLHEVFKAIEEGRPVIAPDGKKCYVVKWKNGRAKIRRYTGKAIAQAWVPIAKLRVA